MFISWWKQCGSEDKERSLENLTLTRITKSTIAQPVIRNGSVLSLCTIPSCYLSNISRMLSTGKLSVLHIVSPKQLSAVMKTALSIFLRSCYRYKWHIKINKECIIKDIPNLQTNINCNISRYMSTYVSVVTLWHSIACLTVAGSEAHCYFSVLCIVVISISQDK